MTEAEKLLVVYYLSDYRERAEKGLKNAQLGLDASPLSESLQGMALRFAHLISLIDDMVAQVDGSKKWRPLYLKAVQALESPECPPPT